MVYNIRQCQMFFSLLVMMKNMIMSMSMSMKMTKEIKMKMRMKIGNAQFH